MKATESYSPAEGWMSKAGGRVGGWGMAPGRGHCDEQPHELLEPGLGQ